MKIGLDVHVLGGRDEGTVSVWQNLLEELPPKHRYVLYSFDPALTRSLFPQGHFEHRRLFTRQPHLRIQFVSPLLAWRDRCDVLHCNYAGPWWGSAKLILTIQDVIWLDFPQFAPASENRLNAALRRKSARRAARIVTGSSYSKTRIVHYFGVPEEKIDVVPNGLSAKWYEPQESAIEGAWRALQARLPDRYVLSVGRWDPRKNFPLLARITAELKRLNLTDALVIVGPEDFGASAALRELQRDRTTDLVVRLSGLSIHQLQAVYRHAQCLLYLPLAEGFGLPVLEAMAMGIPVIAANRTALPELWGGAALFVDGTDIAEAVEAVRRLMADPAMARELVARGRKRAQLFTAAAMAEKLQRTYELAARAASSIG